MPRPTLDTFDKFNSKVNKTDTCWLWTGSTVNGRYGKMNINKKCILAHRLSYELHNNITLNNNDVILHSCDNMKCVNPNHLSIGSPKDNTQDMMSKGRGKNGTVKLTLSQARDIRTKYKTGKYTYTTLALEYNVSFQAIHLIIKNKTWIEEDGKPYSYNTTLLEFSN